MHGHTSKEDPVAPEELFWELVEPMLTDPAITRSTMMGLPCVRRDGRFFACLDRRGQALIVKLPRPRVTRLVQDGIGRPFAPAGKVFREWVALPDPDERLWQDLLAEARANAADPDPAHAEAATAYRRTAGPERNRLHQRGR
jgi:hypothetical protein